MKRITLTIILLAISSICFSETIVLKTGKKIEGEILEKTDKYIKIDFQGVHLTYFLEDVASIETGKADSSMSKKVSTSITQERNSDSVLVHTLIAKAKDTDPVQYDIVLTDSKGDKGPVIKVWQQSPYLKIVGGFLEEVIFHPDEVYIFQKKENKFLKLDTKKDPSIGTENFFGVPVIQNILRQINESNIIKVLGTEVIDDNLCTVAEVSFASIKINQGMATGKIWIWNDKGIPLKFELVTGIPFLAEKTEYKNFIFGPIPKQIFDISADKLDTIESIAARERKLAQDFLNSKDVNVVADAKTKLKNLGRRSEDEPVVKELLGALKTATNDERRIEIINILGKVSGGIRREKVLGTLVQLRDETRDFSGRKNLYDAVNLAIYQIDPYYTWTEAKQKGGSSKEYNPDGVLIQEETYKDGKLNGITKVYYDTGRLWKEINYKDGKREGEEKIYNLDGSLLMIRTYKDGQLINEYRNKK